MRPKNACARVCVCVRLRARSNVPPTPTPRVKASRCMRSLSASADLHKGMNRVPSLQQPRQQREPEPAVPLRPIDLCCGVNHTAVAADNAMALELWPDALFFLRPNHLGTEPTPYTRASSRETRLGLGFPCSVQFARGGRGDFLVSAPSDTTKFHVQQHSKNSHFAIFSVLSSSNIHRNIPCTFCAKYLSRTSKVECADKDGVVHTLSPGLILITMYV